MHNPRPPEPDRCEDDRVQIHVHCPDMQQGPLFEILTLVREIKAEVFRQRDAKLIELANRLNTEATKLEGSLDSAGAPPTP